jgi:hypothetical protein
LVVGLQGRFEEAQRIAQHELSSEQADANMAYLRTMMAAVPTSWRKEDKTPKRSRPQPIRAVVAAHAGSRSDTVFVWSGC